MFALISQKAWEIVSVIVTTFILTATSSANFLTNDWKRFDCSFEICSSQWLGTSDMSLKKVQVATSSDFC